jgi:ubiquinone/menaquinone biosynthesis C-methylase UbiE
MKDMQRQNMLMVKSQIHFFKEQIDKLIAGKILMPAEGEGRNALYAAQKGWQAEAFDISDEGQKKALNLAKEKGVAISYQVGEISEIDLPENSFDAMGLIYAHFPAAIKSTYHK